MGVAEEINPSNIWQLNVLKNTSPEVKSTENNCVAADHEIAKKALSEKKKSAGSNKKLCVCAPTTHPGSFRCSLHRATARSHAKNTKTTQTPGLSRFAGDVSQQKNQVLHKPEYNSE